MPKKIWSDEEETALKLVGPKFSLEALTNIFQNKTKDQISDKLDKLGIRQDKDVRSRTISAARKTVEANKRQAVADRIAVDPNVQAVIEALDSGPPPETTESEREQEREITRQNQINQRDITKLKTRLQEKGLTIEDFITYEEIVKTLNSFEVDFFVDQLASIAKGFKKEDLTSIDRNNVKLYCVELVHLRRIDEAIKRNPNELIALSKTRDNATKRLATHQDSLNASRVQRLKGGGDKGVSFLSFVSEFGNEDPDSRFTQRMKEDQEEEDVWNKQREENRR